MWPLPVHPLAVEASFSDEGDGVVFLILLLPVTALRFALFFSEHAARALLHHQSLHALPCR